MKEQKTVGFSLSKAMMLVQSCITLEELKATKADCCQRCQQFCSQQSQLPFCWQVHNNGRLKVCHLDNTYDNMYKQFILSKTQQFIIYAENVKIGGSSDV